MKEMDSEPGVVRAVKITNAKVDGKLEVDPDLIAASSDTLCYSGETIKIKITGRMRYRVTRLCFLIQISIE